MDTKDIAKNILFDLWDDLTDKEKQLAEECVRRMKPSQKVFHKVKFSPYEIFIRDSILSAAENITGNDKSLLLCDKRMRVLSDTRIICYHLAQSLLSISKNRLTQLFFDSRSRATISYYNEQYPILYATDGSFKETANMIRFKVDESIEQWKKERYDNY